MDFKSKYLKYKKICVLKKIGAKNLTMQNKYIDIKKSEKYYKLSEFNKNKIIIQSELVKKIPTEIIGKSVIWLLWFGKNYRRKIKYLHGTMDDNGIS